MMKAALPFLLALLMLPLAAAQEDACSEADPCVWVVTVDENGLSSDEALAGTAGDWFVFEFNNLDADGADHTITSSSGDSWDVTNIDTVTTAAFQLSEGSHSLSDDVTGDTLAYSGSLDDIVEGSGSGSGMADSDGESSNGAPGFEAVALLAGVLAVALVARRH